MKIETPPTYPPECYKYPIAKEDGGAMAGTHLAAITDLSGNEKRAYIKHYGPDNPKGLFNEWFGYTILKAMNVPQPPAALMQAPRFKGKTLEWAFVSTEPAPLFEGSAKALYDYSKLEEFKALKTRLLACPAIPLIIAADQLISNPDRNIGNILFTGKHTILAIDQGEILGGSNWIKENLHYAPKWAMSKLLEVSKENGQVPTNLNNSLVVKAEEVERMFFAAQMELRKVLQCESYYEHKLAFDHVWWRGLSLVRWFKHELNYIL